MKFVTILKSIHGELVLNGFVAAVLTAFFLLECSKGLSQLRQSDKITLNSVESLEGLDYPTITFNLDGHESDSEDKTLEDLYQSILQPNEFIFKAGRLKRDR